MATLLEQVESALGTDKLRLLAFGIDNLRDDVRHLQGDLSLDEEIETLDLEDLAAEYGVKKSETLKKQICAVVGDGAVFKLGKRLVIRKRKFLEFLQAKEQVT